MNKFHISLLAVLCVVSGVNAMQQKSESSNESAEVGNQSSFSLYENAAVLQKNIDANTCKSKNIVVLCKDVVVYKYGPSAVAALGSLIGNLYDTKTPAFIKRNVPALPNFVTDNVIVRNAPKAVNAENASRVVAEGLQKLFFQRPVNVSGDGMYIFAKAPLTQKAIIENGKNAVNGMKDATVALTAVELLSWIGNAIVAKAGGQRGEQLIADYGDDVKAFSYAVCKQLSAVYGYEFFSVKSSVKS